MAAINPKLSLALAREIYGVPRDGYVGEFQPPVAEPIQRAKLVTYQRDGAAIRAEIDDRGTRRLLRIEHADHAELGRLGDCDRATLQAALIAIRAGELREVGDAK